MTFDNVVVQINEMVETQRDSGTYFEYLARVYFQNKPTYQNEFKNIWMISDVPEVYGIPKADIGVDLVAKKHQVKTDKKSGITDDPNDYSTDEKYIFNLLLGIINVSVQTVDFVDNLPKFEVEK